MRKRMAALLLAGALLGLALGCSAGRQEEEDRKSVV